MSGARWPRRAKSLRSSVHSGCPTITQKSSHCCPVPTPTPTSPSLVPSTPGVTIARPDQQGRPTMRSEEHTYALQSLMRNSYHYFCLTIKKHDTSQSHIHTTTT